MYFAQYYESTVMDQDLGVGLRMVSLPASVVGPRQDIGDFAYTIRAGAPVQRVDDESQFVNALAFLLAIQVVPSRILDRPPEESRRGPARISPNALQRALALWTETIGIPSTEPFFAAAQWIFETASVPVEQSPLSGKALAHLLMSSPKKWVVGTAVGVYALQGQPLVLVSVPTGIIAVMAAAALGSEAVRRIRSQADADSRDERREVLMTDAQPPVMPGPTPQQPTTRADKKREGIVNRIR
jgi:hypothetical protein